LKAQRTVPERTNNNKKQLTPTSSNADEELKEEFDPFLVPNQVLKIIVITLLCRFQNWF